MVKADDCTESPPSRTWNYRVIEFVISGGETRRAIHEVYYVDGAPRSYVEHAAAVEWDTDESDSAAYLVLNRMRDALSKPVLRESDFDANTSSGDETASAWRPPIGPENLSLADALGQPSDDPDFEWEPKRVNLDFRSADFSD